MSTPGGFDRPGSGRPPHDALSVGVADAGTPRPAEVRAAFWLWVAKVVLGFVSVTVSALTLDDTTIAQVREQLSGNPDLPAVDAQTVVRAALVAGVVFSLLFGGVMLLFAFKMAAGRSWARTTLTVVGGLSVALTLGGLSSANAVVAAVDLLGAVLVVAAIVLMFTGDARVYFSPRPRS